MGKVSNATTAVGSSVGWFKVYESGLVSDNADYWATEVMNVRLASFALVVRLLMHAQNNCGHVTFTVPSVSPGQYLLRPEVIGACLSQAYVARRVSGLACSTPRR
jgi:cellulase